MFRKKEIMEMLERIPDDEPLFLLRAQDILSDQIVEQWALEARDAGVHDDKINEALTCANLMSLWPTRKVPD